MASPDNPPASKSFMSFSNRLGQGDNEDNAPSHSKQVYQIDPSPITSQPASIPGTRIPLQTSPSHSSASFKNLSPTNSVDNLPAPSRERQDEDNVRPAIGNALHPSARIILTADTPNEHSFYFEPITFKLVDHGPRMILCRSEHASFKPTAVTLNKISFGTRVVTRGCHACIWLEDERIWIQDMGSSAGTWVNHIRLAEQARTSSKKFELTNNDIIVLGQDYKGPNHQDFSFKCVMARISIEYISTEITFHCRSNCYCTWRALFDRLGIYSLNTVVGGPRQIYVSMNIWMHSPGIDQLLEALNPEEGELLMAVIEKIIETMSHPNISPYVCSPEKLTPVEISSCRSWIRRVARRSGVFPRSLVLHGVRRVDDEPVASGGFSDVYKGMYEDSPVALKVIRLFGTMATKRQVHKGISHEILLWSHLRHPHILPFMGICHDLFSPRIVLVSPWMKNGDILSYMEKNPQKDRIPLLSHCAHGLKYLHGLKPPLVHSDIKCGNILIDDEGNARLFDFGLVSISETQNFNTTIHGGEYKGVVRWMAPELFKLGEKKSRAADVYAFGMTMIEVYTGKPPFSEQGYRDVQVMLAVSGGAHHPRPSASILLCELPDGLWELIESCQKEHKSRPNAQQIVDELDSLHARCEYERIGLDVPLEEQDLLQMQTKVDFSNRKSQQDEGSTKSNLSQIETSGSLSSSFSPVSLVSLQESETAHDRFGNQSGSNASYHNSVQVTLRAHTPYEGTFDFENVSFELFDQGSPMTVCRIEHSISRTVIINANIVSFTSGVIGGENHASIWLETNRVYIKDIGSCTGTWVNGESLQTRSDDPSPLELRDNDVIVMGKYCGDPTSNTPVKCVMARVTIDHLSKDVIFRCEPMCHCPWRKLFNKKGIYSLEKPVLLASWIFEALKVWFQSTVISEELQSWSPSDGKILINVLEHIISARTSFTVEQILKSSDDMVAEHEVALCLKWIRNVCKNVGIFPGSFILYDVKKTEQHPIDCGGFADIYKGSYEGKPVAVKVTRSAITKAETSKMQEQISREALLWRHLKHNHILPLLGIAQDFINERVGLVSPWMPHGNVRQFLETNKQADRLSLLIQSAQGLKYLHEQIPALIHGDIKAANILVDGDGAAKLGDFGLMTISETQAYLMTTKGAEGGSTRWMSPELMEGDNQKSRTSDIYAFGMTAIEIYTGREPFFEEHYRYDVQIIMAVLAGVRPRRPTIPCEMPEELWGLIQRCWSQEAQSRPDIQQVVHELSI